MVTATRRVDPAWLSSCTAPRVVRSGWTLRSGTRVISKESASRVTTSSVAVSAAGDFNGDGGADLAIAAPGENLSSGDNDNDGMVVVLYGTGDTSAPVITADHHRHCGQQRMVYVRCNG